MSGRGPYSLIIDFDWSILYAHQIKILRDYMDVVPETLMKPVEYYNHRKGWESKYDPKFHQKGGIIEVRKVPDVSSLPSKKWVLPRRPDEDTAERRREHRQLILKWLLDQKFKYQVCIVKIDGLEREVFLFKKESVALMFKLAWG